MIFTLSDKHAIGDYGPEKYNPDIQRGVLLTSTYSGYILIAEGDLEFEKNTGYETGPIMAPKGTWGVNYPRKTMPKGTVATFTQDSLP